MGARPGRPTEKGEVVDVVAEFFRFAVHLAVDVPLEDRGGRRSVVRVDTVGRDFAERDHGVYEGPLKGGLARRPARQLPDDLGANVRRTVAPTPKLFERDAERLGKTLRARLFPSTHRERWPILALEAGPCLDLAVWELDGRDVGATVWKLSELGDNAVVFVFALAGIVVTGRPFAGPGLAAAATLGLSAAVLVVVGHKNVLLGHRAEKGEQPLDRGGRLFLVLGQEAIEIPIVGAGNVRGERARLPRIADQVDGRLDPGSVP